jgi:hypothetical protein
MPAEVAARTDRMVSRARAAPGTCWCSRAGISLPQRTAGVDVERTYRTATLDASVGEGFWTPAHCDGGGEAPGPASESLPRRKPLVGRTLFGRARPMGFWGRGGSARWEFGSSPKRERRGDCLGGRVARYQRTIRVEEAAAASALGQMPARCPAVGG